MVTPENTAAPVARTALRITGPVPADSRQYVWSSHTTEFMDQPGKVANPARGQLKGKINIPLSSYVPENLVSRDGFSRPVQRQPAHSPCSGWQ